MTPLQLLKEQFFCFNAYVSEKNTIGAISPRVSSTYWTGEAVLIAASVESNSDLINLLLVCPYDVDFYLFCSFFSEEDSNSKVL